MVKKILILGSSGAGKSTLAKRIGEKLNIPVLHLDTIFWEENWVIRDKTFFRNDLFAFLEKDSFIIDGNHDLDYSFRYRLEAADTIILLNFNRFICFYGAIKRYFKYKNKTRSSITEGCNEKIDFEFAKWILWDYPKKKKEVVFPLINKYFKGNIYNFKKRKELNTFLKEIGVSI